MKKIIALLMACMMVIGLFAACAPANTGSTGDSNPADTTPVAVTLKVWAPQEDQVDDSSWLQTRLAAFEAAHPEYDITWDLGVCGEGSAKELVGTDPAAAADIYMYANDQIGTLVEAGALAELGGTYLEQVKNNVSQTYLNSVTYDGGVYGFPMTCNTWFMYYNKEVLSEEDIKSLETILSKGTVAFPLTTGWYNGAMFLANGGTIFGAAGDDAEAGIAFGGEAGYAAAKKMIELAAHENFVNDESGKGNAGLKDGSIIAYFNGSWEYEKLYEALGDKLGAAPLPTVNINGKDVSMKSLAGSKVIGVNPHCKNQKVAMEVAAFLANADSQLARFQMRNITPAISSLAETDAVKASICAQAEIAVMNGTSVVQPGLPEMDSYWGPMETFGKNIISGEINADNVTESVDLLMDSLNNTGL